MICRSLSAVAIVLCTLAPSSLLAQAIVSPAVADDANRGSVRVLIRLQTTAVPEARLPGASAIAAQRQRIAAAQSRVIRTLTRPARHRYRTLPWLAMEVTAAELARLAQDPAVAAIHRDLLMAPALAQSVPFIGAPVFWQAGYQARGWTVVVIDTGVDSTHPALAGRVVHEACFSTNMPGLNATSLCAGGGESATGAGSAQPCPSSVEGCFHGTLIAGVVGARTAQISGVAPQVSLAAIQVFSRFQNVAVCGGDDQPCARSFTSDQIAALEHVLEMAGPNNQNRIAAANLSLSGAVFGSTSECEAADGMLAFKEAAGNLRDIGIPTIVASGNNFEDLKIGAPACVSTAVSVGGTDEAHDVMFGQGNRAPFLSLLAPALNITSTLPGGGFGTSSGTSLAAGFVSGGWALLKQFMPNATVPELLQALRDTGVMVPDFNTNKYPRIRLVHAALAANGGMPVPPGQPKNANAVLDGNHVTFEWKPPTTGNGPTRYVVTAGSQPSAADLGSFDVGLNTSIAAFVGVGTYHVRVRAENPGGASAPTDDQTFTVAPPNPPSMFTSNVVNRTVTLTWQAPNTGTPPTSYVIEAGTDPTLSNIVVFDTGNPMASVVVKNVPKGVYHVRVRAKNALGLSTPTDDIIVTVE